jgi:hypothetical protein
VGHAEAAGRRLVLPLQPGAVFKNGKLIERLDESESGDQQVA